MNTKQTARIHSVALTGIECIPVEIEVDIANGLPQFIIVGLPDAAVSEARDRVRSALVHSGYSFPDRRITVNLAPAHIRKVGSLFDLPIALGILVASGVIAPFTGIAVGELALDGRLRRIAGALPIASYAQRQHAQLLLPHEHCAEVGLLGYERVVAANSLLGVVQALESGVGATAHPDEGCVYSVNVDEFTILKNSQAAPVDTDMKYIAGHTFAKRALTVAAAGGHNIALWGPPGVGKSMLARTLPAILPPLTRHETIEATMTHSLLPHHSGHPIRIRPFRSPHHSATVAALLGGGNDLHPGELPLAHTGVLFLDELPEFRRDFLEALRQPLENGVVQIHRAHGNATYPAICMLVAAYNPCPCGWYGESSTQKERTCRCSRAEIERYMRKLSGPLLDRIDIRVRMGQISAEEVQNHDPQQETESAMVQSQVIHARTRQIDRQGVPNAQLNGRKLIKLGIENSALAILNTAIDKYGISLRKRAKTLAVAQTIADLEGAEYIKTPHVAEALQYAAPMQTTLH